MAGVDEVVAAAVNGRDGSPDHETQAQMEADLFKAVVDNDPAKLEELIKNGADVDVIFEDCTGVSTKSLLHVSCEKDRIECARVLLHHGALVNMRDNWGQSPLMCCMITQVHDIAELLLSRDPTIVDHQDRFGKTALHCAVESDSIEAVELLLKYNADVCLHTSDGITAVMTAVTLTSEAQNRHRMIQMMIDAGYDLEMKDFRGKRTALQMAVFAKDIIAVELLLAAGADVNTMDSGWRTPLTTAIFRFARKPPDCTSCVVDPEGEAIIKMLTESKADLNLTLVEFCNPLIACAIVDCGELAQYFLEKGSDVDVQFKSTGSTPLILATTKNNLDVFRVFLKWNCNLSPKGRIQRRRQDYCLDAFEISVFLGHLEMTRTLVMTGYGLQRIGYLKNVWCTENLPVSLQENPDLLDWLRTVANNPRSLSEECAFCIRRVLGKDVEQRVSTLPLPSKSKDLITLSDVLSPNSNGRLDNA
ncbi:serine/threonine-protein phosphatase 6 regulatory ankyrin repeat subunit C-like isoform X2 [Liolophura sinensis]